MSTRHNVCALRACLTTHTPPVDNCVTLGWSERWGRTREGAKGLGDRLWSTSCPTYLEEKHPLYQRALNRESSKQTKKNSVRTETNRNKICFGCVSVCFVKPKKNLVCFGVSNLYRNNRNKQNCFETNRNNLKLQIAKFCTNRRHMWQLFRLLSGSCYQPLSDDTAMHLHNTNTNFNWKNCF